MAKRNAKISKKNKRILLNLVVLALIAVIGAIYEWGFSKKAVLTNIPVNNSLLQIYFFDVGQADSSLILNDGKAMLIDGGNDSDGEKITSQIRELGIEKIDYIIATHMHADHIGGLDDVINSFSIGEVYMPDTDQTDKQVEEFLEAIDNKNLKITIPEKGDTFMLGNVQCEVMAVDNSKPKNINLSSIVLQLEFGTERFLFTGDAEKEVENTRTWDKVDVLKVGHHGSDTSSSKNFINQIKPEIAVISVGKNNSYHLPKQSTIDTLQQIDAKVYRTDKSGTIYLESNGENITVKEMGKE